MSSQPQLINEIDDDLQYEIINGDSLNEVTNFDSGRFDLIVTSPPYNVGKAYEKRTGIEDYLEIHKKIIFELVRTLSERGSLCWQVGNFVERGEVFPLDIFYYRIFKEFGLKLRNRIIWHFGHGLHASNRFSGRYETLLWFTKTDDYIFNLDDVRIPSKYPGKLHFKGPKRGLPSGNPLGKNPSDVWEIVLKDWESALWNIPNVKSNHPEKVNHPCQFPIELVERCVLALTNEGGWVLDPFVGVGSSVIASLKNHRNAIGIEKDATFCEIAEQRIDEFNSGQLPIRPIDKAIHVPSSNDKIAQRPDEWTVSKERTSSDGLCFDVDDPRVRNSPKALARRQSLAARVKERHQNDVDEATARIKDYFEKTSRSNS